MVKANQEISDSTIHLYHLILWDLDNYKVDVKGLEPMDSANSREVLQEIFWKLEENSQRAMDFLKKGEGQGDAWMNPREFIKQKTPEEAAA